MTGEAVISLRTQNSGRGKHDSGVQIPYDTFDAARIVDNGLCAGEKTI